MLHKFMTYIPIRANTQIQNSQTIENLSKSGLRSCTKFGQAYSNDGRKITTLSLISHYILDFWI